MIGHKNEMIAAPIDTYGILFFSYISFFSTTASVRIGRQSITAEYWLEGKLLLDMVLQFGHFPNIWLLRGNEEQFNFCETFLIRQIIFNVLTNQQQGTLFTDFSPPLTVYFVIDFCSD
jgi:hypothetical protein